MSKKNSSELKQAIWSVIDATEIKEVNLSYNEAKSYLQNHKTNRALTIVTNDCAARMIYNKKQNEKQNK